MCGCDRGDWTAIAVSLSTNSVKLYSPETAQYYGELKGHSDTVNQIEFSTNSPHLLHSCSSDGTIRSWDTRSFQQVACIDAADNGQEVFSFSFGGSADHLLAAGCKHQVLFPEYSMFPFCCYRRLKSAWIWGAGLSLGLEKL